MNPVILKLGAYGLVILSVLGMWVTVYEDDIVKIEAKLDAYHFETDIADFEVRVLNKLSQAVTIVEFEYSMYADEALEWLVAKGVARDIYLPSLESVTREFSVELQNIELVGGQVYLVAELTYEIDGEIDTVHLQESIQVPQL